MPRTPTIGIVAALAEELAAIKLILDEPSEERVDNDRAAYFIATATSAVENDPHEVVLTQTVEAGNDSAATACTNMIRSFPSVNCVIMAGIAAGVPTPKHPSSHVRLGDIVVASWGIIDYDHVDETDDGPRLRDGFPTPSPLLKVAANLLEAEEKSDQRRWEPWLDSSRSASIRLFRRPPDRTDAPYSADGRRLRHPPRSASGHVAGRPKVHYGLVGSANKSLRNARVREELAALYKLRALEMEGSGIGRSSSLNLSGLSSAASATTATTGRLRRGVPMPPSPPPRMCALCWEHAHRCIRGGGHSRGSFEHREEPATSNITQLATPTIGRASDASAVQAPIHGSPDQAGGKVLPFRSRSSDAPARAGNQPAERDISDGWDALAEDLRSVTFNRADWSTMAAETQDLRARLANELPPHPLHPERAADLQQSLQQALARAVSSAGSGGQQSARIHAERLRKWLLALLTSPYI